MEDNDTLLSTAGNRGEKAVSPAAHPGNTGNGGEKESRNNRKNGVHTVSKNQIEEAVVKIITENQNNDKETGLGEVGSRLVKLYPDFDVRRYGYSLLSKFLETFPKLKLKQDGTKVTVTLYEDKSKKEMLEEFIVGQVQNAGKQGILLGTLGNRIRSRFGDFKVRDYGFSQFKQYIQSFAEIGSKMTESRIGRCIAERDRLLLLCRYFVKDVLNYLYGFTGHTRKSLYTLLLRIHYQCFLGG